MRTPQGYSQNNQGVLQQYITVSYLAAADVNGDGSVNAVDAYYIILFYSEKISKFPQ